MARRKSSSRPQRLGQPLSRTQWTIRRHAQHLQTRLAWSSQLTAEQHRAFCELVGLAQRAVPRIYQAGGRPRDAANSEHGPVLRVGVVVHRLDQLIAALNRCLPLPTLEDLPPDDLRYEEFERRRHFFDRHRPAAPRREVQREWDHIAKDLGLQAPCVPRWGRAVNPAFATPPSIPVEHIRRWTVRDFSRMKRWLRTTMEPVMWEVAYGDGHHALDRRPLPRPERWPGGPRKKVPQDRLRTELARHPRPSLKQLATVFDVTPRTISRNMAKLPRSRP